MNIYKIKIDLKQNIVTLYFHTGLKKYARKLMEEKGAKPTFDQVMYSTRSTFSSPEKITFFLMGVLTTQASPTKANFLAIEGINKQEFYLYEFFSYLLYTACHSGSEKVYEFTQSETPENDFVILHEIQSILNEKEPASTLQNCLPYRYNDLDFEKLMHIILAITETERI